MTSVVAGDRIWVADDHNETTASGLSIVFPGTPAAPNIVVCFDHTKSSPGTNDYLTTAVVANSTAANLDIQGSFFAYGITFIAANGASGTGNFLKFANPSGAWQKLVSCNLRIGTSGGSGAGIQFGSNAGAQPNKIELVDTFFQGTQTSFSVQINGHFTMRGGGVTGSVFPTTLFTGNSGGSNTVELLGVDFNNLGSGKTIVASITHSSKYYLRDCKLNAASAICATPTGPGNAAVYVNNCDSSGTNYRNETYLYEGVIRADTAIVRTTGASDGTTPFSWAYVTNANALWIRPLELPDAFFRWNSTTGSPVTLTVYGLWNAAVLPNNDDLWLDASFQGTSGFPTASFATGTKANYDATGTALTADTSAWDNAATNRANGGVYALGDVIKVASNAGRIFFCTTAGTAAGSEPGGYASAVDGGSVTDNTAVFRAAVRFRMTVTCTSPTMVGPIYATPRVGRASSTFWLDPELS